MKHYTKSLFLIHFFISSCYAYDSGINMNVAYTIIVDQSGKGNFTKIQQAVDAIPYQNPRWIRILIHPGVYLENVVIKFEKPRIFLEGYISNKMGIATIIQSDVLTASTASFTSYADYIVAKRIVFKNNYNVESIGVIANNNPMITPALAAKILGDKNVFYKCNFIGVQDTLYDAKGRHYFLKCYIEGAVDFIFGNAQSFFANCFININQGKYIPGANAGYITAQGRSSSSEPTGFVFRKCNFYGDGRAYLGRAYGPYSRVVVLSSSLSDVIVPEGWDAWNYIGQEQNLFYEEFANSGPGANLLKRVLWEKRPDISELKSFSVSSFINSDGWLDNLPVYIDPTK